MYESKNWRGELASNQDRKEKKRMIPNLNANLFISVSNHLNRPIIKLRSQKKSKQQLRHAGKVGVGLS
jgi:hypothetical protein